MNPKFTTEKTDSNNQKWQNCINRQDDGLYTRSNDLRSDFYRDYTRVLHSQPYSRLKHKTQVFFATQNDHICTRMEHVHHVASVSYTIAKQLGLNIELTQAIALSHDIGHAPFGHEGEVRLNEILKTELNEKFWHEKNGLYVVDKIATIPNVKNKHDNFNLTYAVRDGIISHCGEIDENGIFPRKNAIDLNIITEPNEYSPYTWEACVVKISDKIAYLGRDIQDAMELGIITKKGLYGLKCIIKNHSDSRYLNNTVLIHKLITDLCENSSIEKGICFSEKSSELINEVKKFNYKHIYSHSKIQAYKEYSGLIINSLYAFLIELENIYRKIGSKPNLQKHPILLSAFDDWLIKYSNLKLAARKKRFVNEVVYNLDSKTDFQRAIIDFIAGMTDNFAIKAYNEITRF